MKSIAKQLVYGGANRWCPVCEKGARQFKSFGLVKRGDAQCPWCLSVERHRFVALYFRKMPELSDSRPKRLLHIAPEPSIERILRAAAGDGYLSGDLMAPNAMEQMDITDIHHKDETFDFIYCSHVLEHVPDDRRAMREFYRVLKPGGLAILNVPITTEQTFEDPSIEDPAERERVFGQHDHVRRYGPDYVDRLREAGFGVKTIYPCDVAADDELVRFGLTPASGEIYLCTK